jgi:deazaflavin-dependent oxidoreductase (nitroreductase family)
MSHSGDLWHHGDMPLTGEYAPSPDDWSREQAELFERTNGAEGNEMQGKPIIVLTTLGARSGKIRKTPLMRVEHDGQYVVVASKGGAPEHPTWYHNIVNAPLVELQDGAVRKDYTPRELEGDERAVWWDRAVEAWPAYADYATKTDRLIPVFLLTAVE